MLWCELYKVCVDSLEELIELGICCNFDCDSCYFGKAIESNK